MKYKGFTLAEVMIVLTVIGILAGILIPVANNSRPDENVMKFKKANATLANVIHELVTSDKYYCKGDLGLKANCKTTITNRDGVRDYFCQTVADLLSTKKVNCIKAETCSVIPSRLLSNEDIHDVTTGSNIKRTVTKSSILATKQYFDSTCIKNRNIGEEIVTTDGIVYYSGGNCQQFGSLRTESNDANDLDDVTYFRYFSPPNQFPANYADQNGFDIAYKIFCIDIDGIASNATDTNCVNECPFGYGIRADGKILPGARADEWLEKGFQKGKKDN